MSLNILRFHTHGKMFAYVLHKMVENKEEGVPIDDCHFQHLFDTFAKMFGLRSDIRYEIVHVYNVYNRY